MTEDLSKNIPRHLKGKLNEAAYRLLAPESRFRTDKSKKGDSFHCSRVKISVRNTSLGNLQIVSTVDRVCGL